MKGHHEREKKAQGRPIQKNSRRHQYLERNNCTHLPAWNLPALTLRRTSNRSNLETQPHP